MVTETFVMGALEYLKSHYWGMIPLRDELVWHAQRSMQERYPWAYIVVQEYDPEIRAFFLKLKFYCEPEEKILWLMKYA